MQRMNQRDAASMRQFDSRWNLAQIEFLPTKYTCMLRYVMIRAIHRLASRDTCHDVFAIKNTADFSEYLPSKFVGKNTSCELSKRCGAKCRKRKRGRRREKKSLSLSLSALKNGWWKFARERVFNEFPGSIANNAFHGDERKGRAGCWRVSWLGGSRVIINTGSREEKCQQGKKLSCVDEDQSVARCERACNLGGEGRRGGGKTQSLVVDMFVETWNRVVHISRKPYPFRRKISIENAVAFCYSFASYFSTVQVAELCSFEPGKNFKLARVENTKNFFRMRLPSPRALREFLLGTMILSPSEKKTFEFEHKRLERESSRRG